MIKIIEESLAQAISYKEYRELIKELLAKGRSTGNIQSETFLQFSKLNDSRMKRLDKTFQLDDKTKSLLEKIEKEYIWLVITEGWCGDAAQILPVINKVAEASDSIELKIVIRDDHEDLMSFFLTDGNKAIPKLIVLDAGTKTVIDSWGPRPEEATIMVKDHKEKYGKLDGEFKKQLQLWYNKNKGEAVLEEIKDLVRIGKVA